MLSFLKNFFVGIPAQFRSRLPAAEAAQHLRLLTQCEASAWVRECTAGTVDDEQQVVLWREIYQWRDSFAPRFYGQFLPATGVDAASGAGCILQGAFKPPLFTRVLIPGVVVVGLTAIVVLAGHMIDARAWPFVAGLAVVIVALFVPLGLRRRPARSEPAAIAATIGQALGPV